MGAIDGLLRGPASLYDLVGPLGTDPHGEFTRGRPAARTPFGLRSPKITFAFQSSLTLKSNEKTTRMFPDTQLTFFLLDIKRVKMVKN